MRKWFLLLSVFLIQSVLVAQELNCEVKLNFDRITNVNTQIFKTLETFDTGANRNRIPNFENMLKAYNKVNAHPDQRHKITVE